MITMKSRRLTFGSGILLLINLIVLVLLAIGFMAAYIPPDKNWIFAFAGLVFPYAVIANVVFVFIWMFLWRKLFLISLLALIICWNRLTSYIQWDKHTAIEDVKNEKAKIISYNVQIFDLYNWKRDNISDKGHRILEILKEEAPDIICLQEFHAGKKNKVDIIDSIKTMTGLKYQQIEYVKKEGESMPYGIATFSRWPIISNEIVDFDNNPINFCIYSDLIIYGDTIRLFNVHLESIRLSREDYLYVSELPKKADTQEIFSENSKKIIRKFKRAFVNRAPQARKIAELIDASPYPVVICGDFNDTPSSYTYHQLSNNLQDAYKESGHGIGMTYAGSLPSFRIDYILHDESIKSYNYKTIKENNSDHFPICTDIILP